MSYRKRKTMSGVVLVTFTSMCMQQLSAAMQFSKSATTVAKAAAPETSDEKYSRLLDDLKEQTQRSKCKGEQGQSEDQVA